MCNKGNGKSTFCSKAGIELKDVICIGDNDNDLSMLSLDCFSVCPSNGSSSAKEVADVICELDNNHDVVAWAINCYVFGEEY